MRIRFERREGGIPRFSTLRNQTSRFAVAALAPLKPGGTHSNQFLPTAHCVIEEGDSFDTAAAAVLLMMLVCRCVALLRPYARLLSNGVVVDAEQPSSPRTHAPDADVADVTRPVVEAVKQLSISGTQRARRVHCLLC